MAATTTTTTIIAINDIQLQFNKIEYTFLYIILENNKIWFLANDVTRNLKYKKPKYYVYLYVSSKNKIQINDLTFVNRSGFNELIMKKGDLSRKDAIDWFLFVKEILMKKILLQI